MVVAVACRGLAARLVRTIRMNSLLLKRFGMIWLVSMLALWIVDAIFDSLHFDSLQALALAALVLTLANLFLKPLLVLVTLPITVMTMGLMLPVINE
ncbi:MAG: hypothetical protein EBT14_05385, partial [Betaproteobacteria bacterium]|nr:hypothetical protein [Betaproteobacteria bacterium]